MIIWTSMFANPPCIALYRHSPKTQFYRNKVSHFKRRENLGERDGKSGKHPGFLKRVARICAADLRFELVRNVTVGKACGLVEEPHGPGPRGEVLRQPASYELPSF